jgi:NADPH:quinone reductase-like Zn-dependent oxidoreductase
MSTALELLASKKIRAVIDSVLPLDQASVAHLKMESQSNIQGRIVLKPA